MNTESLIRHPNVYRLIRRVSVRADMLLLILPLGWLWLSGRGPWTRTPWRSWPWWVGWAIWLLVLLGSQVGLLGSLLWATILWVGISVAFVGQRAAQHVWRWIVTQARQAEDAQVALELAQMEPPQQVTPAQPAADPHRLQG